MAMIQCHHDVLWHIRILWQRPAGTPRGALIMGSETLTTCALLLFGHGSRFAVQALVCTRDHKCWAFLVCRDMIDREGD